MIEKLFDVVYWETGKRAIVTRTWGSKTAARHDLERKARAAFGSLTSGVVTIKETRIEWTSKDGQQKRSYYLKERLQ